MRSDAYVRVECDICNDIGMAEEISLCCLAGGGYDERNVSAKLRRSGWRVEGEKDICPNCAEDMEEAPE